MKFVLYCESELDNINDIVKAVENTGKLSVKNVYVSVEQVLEKIDEKKKKDDTIKPIKPDIHRPYVARPEHNGWDEYDKISNMPTL